MGTSDDFGKNPVGMMCMEGNSAYLIKYVWVHLCFSNLTANVSSPYTADRMKVHVHKGVKHCGQPKCP